MKNKYFSMAVIALLILSGAVVAVGASEVPTISIKKATFTFSSPEISQTDDNFIKLEVSGATTTTHTDGAPMLPVRKVVYEFPMGTIIKNVKLEHNDATTMKLPEGMKILPCPTPLPLNGANVPSSMPMDEKIYGSSNYYPEKWFSYRIKVGLNKDNERTTFLIVDVYPVRYSPKNDEIIYITDATLEVSYQEPTTKFESKVKEQYDLLIISASAYMKEMQRLADHKESHGVKTKVVCVDDINGQGRDKQEKIKYYIKEAIENWNIKYVLLVGGYRSFFGLNKPELQIPIRYVYLNDGGEDGFPSDLYYADIYYYDPEHGYAFDDWDSNGNGRYGEWDWYGYDDLDYVPDVHLGRLACRTVREAKIMVDKIINYESEYNGNADWFKRMIVVTGDDFQDQNALDIPWDVNSVPDGEYTIHAQAINCDNVSGPVHEVHVIVDHNSPSRVTFSETDHLITGRKYPAPPVACITVPSEGDVLGNTDVNVPSPPGAYGGELWTPIIYQEGVIHIMGKGYDPQPQADGHEEGVYTTVKVWVTDSSGRIVFGPVERHSEVWFEGEWETEKALDYMPDDFEKVRVWTSNGKFHGTKENPVDGIEITLDYLNEGAGFVYFAGHANPMTWADHYPGIPGGRHNSDIAGLYQINIYMKRPYFPLDTLKNGEKLPIVVLSGCHPAAIDCSLMKLLADPHESMYTAKSGIYAPECLAWWLTRVKNGGAIATLGPTGLGYGMLGGFCTSGAGGWLWPEFFRVYGEEGKDVLGDVWTTTLINYITEFGPVLDLTDAKTVEEMVLLGDPSLKIGGYPSKEKAESKGSGTSTDNGIEIEYAPGPTLVSKKKFPLSDTFAGEYSTGYRITTNTLFDGTPSTCASDGSDGFIVGYARQERTREGIVYQDGFAISKGGVLWKELLMRNGNDEIVHQYVSYAGKDRHAVGTHYLGIGTMFDIIIMPDMINENTWDVLTYYIPSGVLYDWGRNACAIAGDYLRDDIQYIAMFTINTTPEYGSFSQVPAFVSSASNWIQWIPSLENVENIEMASNYETHTALFAIEHASGCYLGYAKYPAIWGGLLDIDATGPYVISNVDLAVTNGVGVVVGEYEGRIISLRTTNDGVSWGHSGVVSPEGEKPEIVGNPDGSFDCYFVKDGKVYVSHSDDGEHWDSPTEVTGITNFATDDVIDAAPGIVVWPTNDGDIYAKILKDTESLTVLDIDVTSDNKKIVATVANSGTVDQSNVNWEIKVEGYNPLYTLLRLNITKGRVFIGESTAGTIGTLASGDIVELTSGKVFGIGHVMITVTVGDTSAQEDGFLLGRYIILHHPRE